MKLSSLSFLIPAYKDEDTVAGVVREAAKTGKKFARSHEIIVINDASPDGTGYVLKNLKKEIPEFRVITHSENKGYGFTIRELYYAGKSQWLFSVPGDAQIPPGEVGKLIPFTGKADMIIGKRVKRQDSESRLRQSMIYNRLLSLMFNLELSDVNSVRLMRSSILKKINLQSESAFVDAELAAKANDNGFRVIEAPIEHRARPGEGAGGGSLKTILPTIFDMMKFFVIRG